MKVSKAQVHTWVAYKGEPHYIVGTRHGKIELLHSDMSTKFVSEDEEVDLIEVPVFHEGELVICVDKAAPVYNKTVTILSVTMTTQYAPYEIVEKRRATPFDIITVNY